MCSYIINSKGINFNKRGNLFENASALGVLNYFIWHFNAKLYNTLTSLCKKIQYLSAKNK